MEYSNLNKNIPTPRLRDFVDYREFIKAWYSFKKLENPLFSYAVWASKAGNDKINFSDITLELGSFIRLDYKLWLQSQNNWNEELEVYRIVTFKDRSYVLLTRDQIHNKVKENLLQDTVILLNASKKELQPLLD